MATTKEKPVVVKKDEQNPEPDVIIAKAIIDLSTAAERMNKGPLTRRAILLLLRDQTDIGMNEINAVLNALPRLKMVYTR